MEETRVSFWTRFQRYEIFKKNGIEFIVPEDVSRSWEYNPIDIENQILCDALNIGKLLDENYTGHSKEIMNFVNQYGLLGVLPDLTETDLDFSEQLVIHENIFYPSGIVSADPFIQSFFPYEEKLIKNQRVGHILKGSQIYKGRSEFYSKLFMTGRYYAEQVDWFRQYFEYLYSYFVDEEHPFELLTFNRPHLTYKIEFVDNEEEGKLALVCEYPSLKSVLDFAFAKAITDDRKPLRYCKHCGKIFYAKDIRSGFCSPRCRNQYNVYKSRAKHS